MIRRVVASIICVVVATAPLSAAPKRSGGRSVLAIPQFTAEQYAVRVQGLNSCDQFFENLSTIPKAGAMLTRLAAVPELSGAYGFRKGEFESTDGFEARKASFWSLSLRDPTRIVLDARIPPTHMTYDPDQGVMEVNQLVIGGGRGGRDSIIFGLRATSGDDYTAHNAYGATVNVTSEQLERELVEFPQGQLVSDGGSVASPKWQIAMSPTDARSFKANAHVVIWVSLNPPFFIDKTEYSKPTYDDPSEFYVFDHIWVGDVKCAAFTNGSKLVSKIAVR